MIIAEQYSIEAYLRATGVDQFSNSFRNAAGNVERVDKASQRASISLGSMFKAIAGSAAVVGTFHALTNAMDGAISRYDTLNNFPKVLEQMGFSAEESESAISKLSDGIQGLPTTLDDVAGTAQRIATLTGNLEGATDTTLALNNAFITSGSSAADAQRGLEQYVQMLSRGEVDLEAWRSLQETMGVALNDVAKSFGFAGASAQNDLYDALKEGEVTFDDFNAKLVELNEETGGFADRAITASGGIRTAFANMGTSIVRGITNIIEAIDRVLAETPFGSIENIIENLGDVFFDVLDGIANAIEPTVKAIGDLYDAIKPLTPLILGLATGFGTFFAITSIGSIVSIAGSFVFLKGILDTVALSFMYLWSAMAANPIVATISILAGLAAMVTYLWQTNETFRDIVVSSWERVQEVMSATIPFLERAGNAISEFVDSLATGAINAFNASVEWMGDAIEKVSDFFVELKDSIDLKGAFNAIAVPLSTVAGLLLGLASPIGWLLKGFALLSTQTSFFSDVMSVFRGEMNIGQLINNVARDLSKFIETVADTASEMIEQGAEIATNFIESVARELPGIIEVGVEMVTNFIEGVANTISDVAPVAVELVAELTDSILSVIPTVVDAGVEVLTSFIEAIVKALPQVLGVGIQIITTLVTAVVSMLPVIIETFVQLVETIINTFVTMLPIMIETYMTIIQTLIDTVITMLPLIVDTFITLVMTIIQTLVENLPLIIDAGIQILMALIDGIISILPVLIESAITIVNALLTTLIDNLPLIIDAGMQILMALIDGIISIIPQLISAGVRLITTLVSQLISLLPELISAGVEILLALIDGIIQTIPQLIEAAIQLITEIVGALIENLPEIIDAGIQIVEALISGLFDMFVDLKDAALALGKQIVTSVGSFVGNMIEVGKDLVGGLISGIGDMAKGAADAAADVAKGAWNASKNFLGINSPSRLFRYEIGQMLGQGMILGMQDEVSAVQKTAEQLGMAATPQMPNVATMDIAGQVARSNAQVNSRIHHELGEQNEANQKEPAYITLVLGSQELETFVEDINEVNAIKNLGVI